MNENQQDDNNNSAYKKVEESYYAQQVMQSIIIDKLVSYERKSVVPIITYLVMESFKNVKSESGE